ncbi:MAG: DUF3800 domain-containing protein [Verrucomicrobiales bacterium]|nr:DUF3800 domain-containing protein [Verrucomicrobiales bacterium]
MLIFLDESFRTDKTQPEPAPFGVLAGVALREDSLTEVARDVYQLKYKHLGADFARDGEIKGKELTKRYAFKLEEQGIVSNNLNLARDLIRYLRRKKIPVFGCVCFQEDLQGFKCQNLTALDRTFRYLFERIDMFIKIEAPAQKAILVFDDRDHGTNANNATAITNFFLRSADGLALNSIIDTPFFGISQAQNVGLQLADFVTTIIGQHFEQMPQIEPMWEELNKSIYRWQDPPGKWHSGLRVIRKP